jgi:uncharacterized protein (DUF58 family)
MFRSRATASKGADPIPNAPQAILRRLEWHVRRAVNTSISGDYRSAFRGRGMEFDQVVKYQWGDDLRDIDWNVTARLGEAYRKKFVEERELSMILLFEDSPALQFGSAGRSRRDSLLETAVLLMLVAALNRDRVGLFYTSSTSSWYERALPGRRGILRLAARLLEEPLPPLDGGPVAPLPWQRMRNAASKGSALLWFGPFVPSETPESWRGLQQRYRTVGIRADDPWDEKLPEVGNLTAYDPLAGRLTTINTSSSAEQAAHRRWREGREKWMAHLFPQVNDRMQVRNTDDPLDALAAFFHRNRYSGARA